MSKKKKSKKKPSNIKPPGKCIFCEQQGNLTKQHVFSDMLKEFIPRTKQGSLHYEDFGEFKPGRELQRMMKPKVDQGDMGTRQIRNVCHDCNSVWINTSIEQKVKTLLGKLILGTALGIPQEDKQILINWIAVTTIMCEYTARNDHAIHRDDRIYLRQNNKPSDHWYVYIGNYDGRETQLYRKMTFMPIDVENYPQTDFSSKDSKTNCQCSIMVLGKLLIVAATIPFDGILNLFKYGIGIHSNKLVKLLPTVSSPESLFSKMFNLDPTFSRYWPPPQNINDEDLLDISNIFKRIAITVRNNGGTQFSKTK